MTTEVKIYKKYPIFVEMLEFRIVFGAKSSECELGNTQLFAILKTAKLQRQIIEFVYLTPDGQAICRQIKPVKLWFKSKAWDLKAFCLLRQSARIFKLTRFRNLTLTDLNFSEREIKFEPDLVNPNLSKPLIDFKLDPAVAYRIFDTSEEVNDKADGSYIFNVSLKT